MKILMSLSAGDLLFYFTQGHSLALAQRLNTQQVG